MSTRNSCPRICVRIWRNDRAEGADMSDASTYFAKVWSDHVIKDLGDGGALLQIDRLVQHEWGAARIVDQFLSGGRRVAQPELVFMMVDHLIDTAPGRGPNQSHAPFGAETIEKA